MTILNETAQQVKNVLGLEYDTTTVERVMIGVFFTGVKLSNGAGGISYTPVKDIPQAVCCPSSAGRIFDPLRINHMKVADVLAELPNIHIYPDPESRILRQAIAQFIGVSSKNILAGAGADELIDLIMRMLLEPEDCILIFA